MDRVFTKYWMVSDEKEFVNRLSLEKLREYAETIKLRAIFSEKLPKKKMQLIVYKRIEELEEKK